MSLLMPSRPIVISPDLAYRIGLNEAIALQQVHYWLKETTSGVEHEGARWIYNTTEQWLEQFPFWSESTLKRTFTSLKKLGLLLIEQLNKAQRDMTNFYTINYENKLLDDVTSAKSIRSKCASPSGQNDMMEQVKVKRSTGSKRAAVIGSKCTDDPTEITTESTTEITNKTSCPVAAQPDPEVLITDLAIEVLAHLNLVSGSRYQKSKTALENIRARLREGYTDSELKLVIDLKHEHWRSNDEMYQYMRPDTLFAPKKFEGYLQSATRWNAKGRPARETWDSKRERDVNMVCIPDDVIPDGFRGAGTRG